MTAVDLFEQINAAVGRFLRDRLELGVGERGQAIELVDRFLREEADHFLWKPLFWLLHRVTKSTIKGREGGIRICRSARDLNERAPRLMY